MASIVPFLRDASFGPDAIATMSKAYDTALKSLHDRGQPPVVKEVIAQRIIALTIQGERDVILLSQRALDGIEAARRG